MPIRAAVIMVTTFVFGIVPATLLVFYALLIGAAGMSMLFVVPDARGALLCVLLVAAAVMALIGYVALFHAAGDAVTARVAWWLGAGMVANVVGIGLAPGQLRWFGPDDGFCFFAPLAVGGAHLVRFAITSYVKRLPARTRCS
jgi:Na+/glutamate symporter